MHSRISLSATALASLGLEISVRVRNEDGVFSIKSSTRPRGVKGEFSFGTMTAVDDAVLATIPAELPVGGFTLEKGKYGWHKLVAAAEGATVTVENFEPVAEVA
jgi:hypothetical protein